MLSRGNSNAGTRLRKAKSASSVKTYQSAANDSPSRDSDLAYKHALTAASVAFEQANGRAVKRVVKDNATPGIDGEGVLKHRRSIRFTGPSAVPVSQRPITQRAAAGNKPSSSPQRSRREPSLRSSSSFVTAVPDQNNEYVERRVSSLPSSYRKLRKAKSMVNTSKGSGLSLVNSFNKRAGHSRNSSLQQRGRDQQHQNRNSIDSRLRKSLSFWRPPNTPPGPTNPIDQDKAVQIARDQYVQQLEEQRLKEKNSIVDLGQSRKAAKPFKRTVRSSSTNSYGSAVASHTATAKPESADGARAYAIGRKARDISISLKTKLKRVFQKPSGADEVVPVQQLNASRAHFGDYASTFNGIQQRYDAHIPSPDTDTIRRIDSRGQTYRETSAFVEKKSHPASIRSIESDQSTEEETSRATSWANSSIANSVALLQSRENKRLSTINEHGAPYQPSSSRLHGLKARNYIAQDDPLRDFSAGSLFGRLRHEIEKNDRIARYEGDVAEERKERQHIADLTPRGSSLNIQAQGVRMSKSIVFNTTAPKASIQVQNPYNESRINDIPGRRPIEATRDPPERTESTDSTPKRPLREVKSAFFPPTTHIERTNTSPYRQAMRSSTEESTASDHHLQTPNASESSSSGRHLPDHLQVKDIVDSSSIYSRTTSGNTPRASDSPSSDSDNDGGTAMVASQPLKYRHSHSPSHNRQSSQVQSSGEWQQFLSTEMAQLDRRGQRSFATRNEAASKALGHKRENAQIDNSDVEVGKLATTERPQDQPIGQLRTSSTSRLKLTHTKTSDSLMKDSPGAPHSISRYSSIVSPKEVPQRSQSRNLTGQSPDSSPSTHALQPCNGLRPKASLTTLSSSSGNMAASKRYGMSLTPHYSASQETLRTPSPRTLKSKSTENAGGRYSAEREIRLRRMQSSNSVDSKRQQENRPFRSSPKSEGKRPSPVTSRSAGSLSPGNGGQLMIDRYLSNRRKDMRISEESAEPVFL